MSTKPTYEELALRVKELERKLSEQSSVSGDPSESATIQDITEQKAMEMALRDSELEYRSTLDAMGDAIHVVDETMCLILENEVFKKWRNTLGLQSEVIGCNIFEAYPFLEDKVRQEYKQVFKTGKPLITEEEHVVNNRANLRSHLMSMQ